MFAIEIELVVLLRVLLDLGDEIVVIRASDHLATRRARHFLCHFTTSNRCDTERDSINGSEFNTRPITP
ncbi:MAG: hypothetical protein WB770_04935 [Acidimicrobiales bacterium]